MRVFGIPASTIDASLGRPKAASRMKCEGLYPILQDQTNVLEYAREFLHEFARLEFMDVIRIRSGLRAGFGVVLPIGGGNNEQTVMRENSRALLEKRAVIRQMLDHLESHHQIEGVFWKRHDRARGDQKAQTRDRKI